jgi:hypothetical protein
MANYYEMYRRMDRIEEKLDELLKLLRRLAPADPVVPPAEEQPNPHRSQLGSS